MTITQVVKATDGSVICLFVGWKILNIFEKHNIKTLGDLCEYSEEDLLSLPQFGIKSLNRVKQELQTYDLKLPAKIIKVNFKNQVWK
tara:strand:+ start:67 stop:327 length:261 start_codon:yes stop_codon:yes gene_type:complete